MTATHPAAGAAELRAAMKESCRSFVYIGLFGAFVNLLMLTGPVFMLQIYDRVLPSRSEATLLALVGIVAFLFLMMGLLDHFRARVLARAGARFQARMDPRVLGAILTRAGRSPQARSALAANRPALDGPGGTRHGHRGAGCGVDAWRSRHAALSRTPRGNRRPMIFTEVIDHERRYR